LLYKGVAREWVFVVFYYLIVKGRLFFANNFNSRKSEPVSIKSETA